MPPLLERRLIFVMGKGGVGRSTVATALGVLAARSGLRTIVAELAGAATLSGAPNGAPGPPSEVELGERLFTIAIDPQHAMEEYLRIKAGALGEALGATRLFQAFAMATPGMRELLSIGKVWELAQFERRTSAAQPYDLVVVDAPATGHGVGLLRTPRTFAEIARVGPIANQGGRIAATIADRTFTGVLAVSTPEEMPVNETLALHAALVADGLELDAVVLNGRYPSRFDRADAAALATALESEDEPLARTAIRAALSEHGRDATQAGQQARLEQAFPGTVVPLPYLFTADLGRPELELLADALAGALR